MRKRFGEAFIEQLWQAVGERPTTTTTQDAVDNFIIAASITANQNLTELFTQHYRWPLSSAAQQALSQRFSTTPTPTNTATNTPTPSRTSSPTATATPTPTNTPTSTFTPSPTPPSELPPTGDAVAVMLDQLQITFTLPAGAVNEPIRVTIKVADSPPATSGFQVLNQIFAIDAVTGNGTPVTQFTRPFILTIHYTDAAIQGLDESQLTLHYWHEAQQAWLAIPTTVDVDNNVLTVTLDHLTTFAVLQQRVEIPVRLFLPVVQR